ncbi:hypothetical protein, partial [Actinobacillus pleuropneumoniae]|uniref:hypothetical protein n=1 Tax=Actinobacillus pleuropneumoniae TaxID=715 RepID=UPI00227D1A29
KLLICSSACVPASGLNLGNHFLGKSGNGCNGAGMLTAPRLFHGFAIETPVVDDIADEIPNVWEGVDIED